MKIKQRLKKALFEFFKEEILAYTVPNKISSVDITREEIKFKKVQIDLFADSRIDERGMYELINYGKHKLINEILPFVKVDVRKMWDDHKIQVHLFLGEK